MKGKEKCTRPARRAVVTAAAGGALAMGAVLSTSATVGAAVTTASNVVVIVNNDDPTSVSIGSQYLALHPGAQVISYDINLTNTETVSIAQYNQIKSQIQTSLVAMNMLTSAHYLVTTKGTPLRIAADPPFTNEFGTNFDFQGSSFDNELTLIGRDYIRQQANAPLLSNNAGAINNPYRKVHLDLNTGVNSYQPFQTFADFKAANSANENAAFYLVSRLDAFTHADVTAMLARAQSPAGKTGTTAVIDDDLKDYDRMQIGPNNAVGALEQLQARGMAVTYDNSNATITATPGNTPVLFYVGHGKNGAHPADYLDENNPELQYVFANGAIFSSYESYNGRTMVQNANTDGQALIGDWIRLGGTGAIGNAWEPFTIGIVHEEVWMPAMLDGYTFADAVWMSTDYVSWQSYMIGDPLMTVPEPACLSLIAMSGVLSIRRKRKS